MNHRDHYRQHDAPRRSDPQGSLARHVGATPLSEQELRALAARALRSGVIVFLKADLEKLPDMARLLIEGEARRLYG